MNLPDAAARLTALTDHDRTLLVEAGAGSGKTALMAGRVAVMLTAGVLPRDIVAITFTEAAASELLERIEKFAGQLQQGTVPTELRQALASPLSQIQRENIQNGCRTLDEITCTTIHGFCQQLVRPYPVETGIDPGAQIIDPAAAELAFHDLMEAWLSARFGRDRSAEGLGRIPPMKGAGGDDDFFAELVNIAPDEAVDLIEKAADFLKEHRSASAPPITVDPAVYSRLVSAIEDFVSWYNGCAVVEEKTAEVVTDLARIADIARGLAGSPITGKTIAQMLAHKRPSACKKDTSDFSQWGKKGKWKDAAKAFGKSTAFGETLSAAGEVRYWNCNAAYGEFCGALGQLAFQRFVAEFTALKDIYAQYKRDAALMDFDDLLHHARDLLAKSEPVRQALAVRYPRILVDEFQDTDPLQAEILWRLAGEGPQTCAWQDRKIRSGALFLVGDPKQAIYRFRGADVATYLTAKKALADRDPSSILEISANFRSQPSILQFVNDNFASMLDLAQGQPGFAALAPVRKPGSRSAVAKFDLTIEDRHRNERGLIAVELRREESRLVADIVQRLIGSYRVWDKDLGDYRPARAGDIALLAPTGTSLWIYERALENQDIPIATQAGKGFFNRQEVQDLIAVARAIADRRDTLALGALLRGPVVGLTEEEIADEILHLQSVTNSHRPLHLWTNAEQVQNPNLKRTLTILQNLARKARRTTPHQLMAEAVEELKIRPILKARYRRGAERALANVELVLEMARPYAARGIAEFSRAIWDRWEDTESQAEGRPDAEVDSVSIVTMHSSKGLEWPIVIPINSMTKLYSKDQFLYRRQDDSVHFAVLDFASPDYDAVKQAEADELRRERVRLWYVALTRARDLLLLPLQSERSGDDWLSLLTLDLASLPKFDPAAFTGAAVAPPTAAANIQDLKTWQAEAAAIVANERTIAWRQPSRHEQGADHPVSEFSIFTGPDAVAEQPPDVGTPVIQGGRERGLVLHKLIEEVLTGETSEAEDALQARAAELLAEMGVADNPDAAEGCNSAELAASVLRGLGLPEILALRPLLRPEVSIFSSRADGANFEMTSGVADALALGPDGSIGAVVDWKSDVDPDAKTVKLYRGQVSEYLAATGAPTGLIVFLTSGRVEKIAPAIGSARV
ncbi:UvrD-helicase domain-containing protein [Rhodoblastus acidophilus]|uniref:DNA 3'-5' helicase n=1 Tax=Candidatus Rhodoblastus alkanivorans TaxID=2954117 RepID=A0ABS9ZB57_9HYPH|nr:UvrD-helicase domain-containing protein [Candidatus Rhodoblastus alkanivorans]MCI4680614.1 UvrD-helicase domain-containing protein [Candidatus Rhodoblastus alkanivorans]MCI4684944.1 UvrD-helicase domain-containing protein [Candidatus Rhodoblastus alkanivorans]MDI4643158.1 UvrD-helicase domain-containing protein [Rhodoblastus acidophilus]